MTLLKKIDSYTIDNITRKDIQHEDVMESVASHISP